MIISWGRKIFKKYPQQTEIISISLKMNVTVSIKDSSSALRHLSQQPSGSERSGIRAVTWPMRLRITRGEPTGSTPRQTSPSLQQLCKWTTSHRSINFHVLLPPSWKAVATAPQKEKGWVRTGKGAPVHPRPAELHTPFYSLRITASQNPQNRHKAGKAALSHEWKAQIVPNLKNIREKIGKMVSVSDTKNMNDGKFKPQNTQVISFSPCPRHTGTHFHL